MKKVFSLLIVLAMLASTCAIFSIPAAAVDGIWDTHGTASQDDRFYEGDEDDKTSVPGYKYTDDGLYIKSADWSTGKPWSHVSTKEKVDLKAGVYMQVRVDSFEYEASDRWFNFNIRNMPIIEPGSGDTTYGEGVQSLIKPERAENMKLKQVNWYTGAFTKAGASGTTEARDENGKHILTFQVTWNGSSYGLTVNGVNAHSSVISYMNEKYAEDSLQYIGFTAQSNKKGGEQSFTILKFGTDEEHAFTPGGNDEKDNENFYNEPVAIADPSEVDEGEPAILMNGDLQYSALKKLPGSALGSEISITDDMLVHVVATAKLADCGGWSVNNDVSYDIADFPVFMVMTKNYCSCGVEKCQWFEEISIWLPTGEQIGAGNENHITAISAHTKPLYIDEDGYLFFIYDVSPKLNSEDNPEGTFGGRINATRVDFNVDLTTPGANEFDVVMQCFFRTVEEAEAYAMDYLVMEGYDPNAQPEEDTTEAPAGGDTTEAPAGGDTTEAPADDTTEAPAGGDTTEAPADETTETPADDTTEASSAAGGTDGDKAVNITVSGDVEGCLGTVGFGAIAIVAIAAAAGYVSFKKKD